jgi:hypothetical protein
MKFIKSAIILTLAVLIAVPAMAHTQACGPASTAPGVFDSDSSTQTSELLQRIEKESQRVRISVEQVKALENTPFRTSNPGIATELAKIRLSAKTLALGVCRLQRIAPGAEPWQVVNAAVSHVRVSMDNLGSAIQLSIAVERATPGFIESTSRMRDSATALGRAARPGLEAHVAD